MCMKNVNANMMLCSKMEEHSNGVLSLLGIFDNVAPLAKGKANYVMDNFCVALNCCIMFNIQKDDTGKYTIINGATADFKLGKPYEFMVRLVPVDSNAGYILSKFELKVEEKDLLLWSKGFYDFKRFINVSELTFSRIGNYVLKLLIREKSTDPDAAWIVQSVTPLTLGGIVNN